MKKIILAILSVLYLVSYGQLEKKNNLTEENLKGKVKSIKENTYEAVDKFGQIKKGNVFYDGFSSPFTIIYNEKGNKIKICRYDKYGKIDNKNTYKYDEKGNNIEHNTYDYGRLALKDIYKYDEKGNKIEENTYDSDGRLFFKYIYKYDEKGNNIEKNKYDYNGRLDSKTTYKYDEKGNTIEQNTYYYDDRPAENYSYKYEYEYDKNNNWTQKIQYRNTIPNSIKERIIEYYP